MEVLLTELPRQDSTELDQYIGLNITFNDPLHLFLNMEDLQQGMNQIYFFLYSAGKKKFIFWGYYDRLTGTFHIDNGCRYLANYLGQYVKKWKERYLFTFDTVKNRIRSRMDAFSGREQSRITYEQYLVTRDPDYENPPIIYEDYRNILYFLSSQGQSRYYKPEVAPQLERRVNLGKIYGLFNGYKVYLDQLELEGDDLGVADVWDWLIKTLEALVKNFEKDLNVKEVNWDITFDLEEIHERFYDFVVTGKLYNQSDRLQVCPTDPQVCFTPYIQRTDLCNVFYNIPDYQLQTMEEFVR